MSKCTNTIDRVISEKFCVGCGGCAIAEPETYKISMNEDGHYSALKVGESTTGIAEEICPFSNSGKNEDNIASELWPDLPYRTGLGRYKRTLACHVSSESARIESGSGGLVTWICAELLRRNEVDAVIHVGLEPRDNRSDDAIYKYSISRSIADVRGNSKSRYYPITLNGVVQEFLQSGERVAFVGVPCFIKVMRNLIDKDIVPRDRAPTMIGLVCGHLKSRYFADYLMWQKNGKTDPDAFDFRTKLMDRPASDYGFTYRKLNASKTYPMASVKAKDWGEGLFKLKACECCDDVLAECADIAIGDAWLPEFVNDPLGENIVVVRDARMAQLLEDAQGSGELVVTPVSPEQVEKSQTSGLRHRREGTSHRLARWKEFGKWAPVRRVPAQLAPTKIRRDIYDLRLTIAETSNTVFSRAKAAGRIKQFEAEMRPALRRLKRLTYGSFSTRVWRKISRKIGAIGR